MKTKLLLGALMVSAMLCGRSQGADLIGRMVSLDEGCAACAQPACEQPACEPACDVCAPRHRCDLFAGLKDLFASRRCAPACEVPACEPAKCVTPEPACEPACGCAKCRPQPVRALVRKIASVGECNACGPAACEPACEKPACEPACEQPACEPACGAPKCNPQPVRNLLRKIASVGECNACGPAACEPACEKPACEPACAEPACEPSCRSCDRPVLNFLKNVFGPRPKCGACAPVSDCGCGVQSAPAAAPSNGAAPLPAAPTPDA